MRGILKEKIAVNKWLLLTLGVFTLFFVPMIIMCFYSVPTADDLFHAGLFRNTFPENGTLTDYFKTVFKLGNRVYETTQGQYTINYMIYLNPAMYNYKLYFVACLLNFFLLFASNACLANVFSKYILKTGRKITLWIFMLLCFLSMQFAPPTEIFYWYAGFIAYTIPYTFFVFAVALGIRIYKNKSKRLPLIVLSAFLGVIIGGTHYPLVLFILCLMATLILLGIIYKKKQAVFGIPFFVTSAGGFFISVIAPGNALRDQLLDADYVHPVKTVYASMDTAFKTHVDNLMRTPVLLLFLLLVPILVPAIVKMDFDFKRPAFVTLFGIGLSASVLAPYYYSAGIYDVPSRMTALLFFIVLLVLLFLLFYWLGWFVKKFNISKIEKDKLLSPINMAICAAALVLLTAQTNHNSLSDMNSLLAGRDLIYGEARFFHAEVVDMFEMIKNSDSDTVIIPRKMRTTLMLHELVVEEGSWQKDSLSYYFGKKLVFE